MAAFQPEPAQAEARMCPVAVSSDRGSTPIRDRLLEALPGDCRGGDILIMAISRGSPDHPAGLAAAVCDYSKAIIWSGEVASPSESHVLLSCVYIGHVRGSVN